MDKISSLKSEEEARREAILDSERNFSPEAEERDFAVAREHEKHMRREKKIES